MMENAEVLRQHREHIARRKDMGLVVRGEGPAARLRAIRAEIEERKRIQAQSMAYTIGTLNISGEVKGPFLVSLYGIYSTIACEAPAKRKAVQIAHDVLSTHYPDITFAEIHGTSRLVDIVIARDHVYYAVRSERPDLSFQTMGRIFNRHHTSVIAAIRRHQSRLGIE